MRTSRPPFSSPTASWSSPATKTATRMASTPCDSTSGLSTSAHVADAPETMPGRPPKTAHDAPTATVEPRPTSGCAPAMSANCDASGTTATADARPASALPARSRRSSRVLSNRSRTSDTLASSDRAARRVARVHIFLRRRRDGQRRRRRRGRAKVAAASARRSRTGLRRMVDGLHLRANPQEEFVSAKTSD